MSVISLREYATIERPEIQWLVPGLVPRTGSIVLTAPPKTGKTFLALQLSLAICTAGSFLGKRASQGTVLYLYVDRDEDLFVDRVRELIHAGVPFPNNLVIPHPSTKPHPLNVMTPKTQTWLRNAVRQASPDLIVVDVIRKLHNSQENDSTEMKEVGDVLEGLFCCPWRPVGEQDVCVLFLHHTYKLKKDSPRPDASEAGRGSSFMSGDASANWLMYGGILSLQGRFHEDLHFTYEKDHYGLLSFPEEVKTLDLIDQLVKLCERHPERSHYDLAKEAYALFKIPQSTYYRYMRGSACVHAVAARQRLSGAVQRVSVPVVPPVADHSADTGTACSAPSSGSTLG